MRAYYLLTPLNPIHMAANTIVRSVNETNKPVKETLGKIDISQQRGDGSNNIKVQEEPTKSGKIEKQHNREKKDFAFPSLVF